MSREKKRSALIKSSYWRSGEKKLAGDYNLGSDAVVCSVIDSWGEGEG